jgi:hypothetical protein
MFTAFLDGIIIFFSYGLEILAFVVPGLGFGSAAALVLFNKRKYDERVVYILLLGFVFVGLAAPFLKLTGLFNIYTVAIVDVLAAAAFILLIRRGAFSNWRKAAYQKYIWIPAVLFGVFLFLRLGYVHGLILPPFVDSAEHFKDLGSLLGLENTKPYTWANFFPYYHAGFHGITAWSDMLTRDSSPLTMTVVAHFLMGLLPASVYLMTLAFSDEDVPSSIFGALLAGVGWLMPAHAVNFGKYPSLAAVCLTPLLFGLFHLSHKTKDTGQWIWRGYFLAVAFCLLWIHSRLIAVLAFFYFAYYLARFLETKLAKNIFETGTAVLTFLLLLGVLILNKGSAGAPYFRYYLNLFDNSTFLVVALLPFAFRRNTVQVLQWMLFTALLVAGTGAALPQGIYSYDLTLLDQPFFELVLFLPLAALGALGLNSLGKLLPPKENYYRDISLFLILVVTANGVVSPQPWSPMESSNYVSRDDLLAFSWIRENVQPASVIIAPSVSKSEEYQQSTDASVWLHVLTGKTAMKIPFEQPWDSESALRDLCEKVDSNNTAYVYVGNKNNSFRINSCEGNAGLTSVFCRPQAKIFTLDCSAVSP